MECIQPKERGLIKIPKNSNCDMKYFQKKKMTKLGFIDLKEKTKSQIVARNQYIHAFSSKEYWQIKLGRL